MMEEIEKEIWKDVYGYERLYMVSNMGRVKTLGNGNSNFSKKDRILKQQRYKKYWRVPLSENGKTKTLTVHRLVATAFIPNPNNLPEINHINENGLDNRAENLEWCDRKYNVNYGTRTKRAAKANTNNPSTSRKVLQFTKSGEFIKEFPSLAEAYRQTGTRQGNIYSCCSGKRNYSTAGGYIWRYKDKK